MEYKVDESLRNFQAWSGGKDTLETLIEKGDCEEVECFIEEVTGDDRTDTDINDILWFERDAIAQHLGYRDWEAYEDGWSESDLEEAEEWWDGMDYEERGKVSGEPYEEVYDNDGRLISYNLSQLEVVIDEWWDVKSDKEKVEIYYGNE